MTDAPLNRTPALDRLLGRLRRRLVRAVWLHGLGTAAAATAAWALFAFVADYVLRVPPAVRIAHGVVLIAVLVVFLIRDLARPLRRLPGRAGLAVLLERRHPELHELLVSAAQLQGGDARAQGGETSPALVDHVLREAEARAAALDLSGVLDESGPATRFGAGAVATAALAALALANPELARIFVDHLLGRRTPWPQRTYLAVEIPMGQGARIESSPERLHVRVARGTDVPVVVRATGVVPSEVLLSFDDGRERILYPSGGGTFRTQLRAPQETLGFHATGGDDDDGLPRVEVEVLQPPDVEGVAVVVQPPEWTGLAPEIAFNRDVEVVAGSHLSVHVLTTPREATGEVRLLPDDQVLALARAPFPRRDDAVVALEQGLSFELDAEASFGYRFELVDATGLSNPDPGLFRVTVLADKAPDVRVLAPGRAEVDTVAGGLIPLRVRAEDDFGLTGLAYALRPFEPGREGEPPAARIESALEHEELPAENARRPWLGAARIEVDRLAQDGELALDQRFELVVRATDNHRPEAQVGEAAPVRIRLISADELLRRVQERLARARLDATRLADVQREKKDRVAELVDAFAALERVEAGDALALHAATVGQRRVQADAATLARDLASAASDVLYARLDEKANLVLERLDQGLARASDATFQTAPWAAVVRGLDQGELGAPVFAGNLVRLVGQALAVSEEAALKAAGDLERAQRAADPEAAAIALSDALASQTESLARIEALLESLAEWDNFQNVLALTRDILNRQKALRDRTQRFAKENER